MNLIDSFRDEYRFLSNFYPAPIQYGDKIFPSSEHLYQAMKCTNIADAELVRTHPFKGLKEFARSLPLDPDWDNIKDDVMRTALWGKFTQNAEVRSQLLATGDDEILEGNYWCDQYYGSCTCEKHEHIPGLNKLGIMLMELRQELRDRET